MQTLFQLGKQKVSHDSAFLCRNATDSQASSCHTSDHGYIFVTIAIPPVPGDFFYFYYSGMEDTHFNPKR